MGLSKIKKIKIDKYDRMWSALVRLRDGRCLFCGHTKNLAAHHFIRRAVKSTRLLVDNGITLCPSCHTFSSKFSAHKTPEAFRRWFIREYPDRAKMMIRMERVHISERVAINKFIRENQ